MKLRKWQSECVEKALKYYSEGIKNFLALATPGAGKTIMGSELAKQLFEQNMIDLVFCFAPSRIVAYDFSQSLEQTIKARFDGLIGSKGNSKTYQGMQYLDESFWDLFKSHRVFVIFDEIHHCAGTNIDNANSWGKPIIEKIKYGAEYTIALTGTPWRSDASPVALSQYCDATRKIKCDYVYGLKEAIHDKVCRVPQFIAIDNDNITLTENDETQHFKSFASLLMESGLPYSKVVQNEIVVEQMLIKANSQLDRLRIVNRVSAGLIVASSISHAWKIHDILRKVLDEDALVVTSDEDKPSETIRQFRKGNDKWVISVGMISEGTNIPRLQVCCLLTNVTTELYFRQILGRILRITDKANQEAIMFMPAEAMLMEFAKNLAQDIPGTVPIVKVETTTNSVDLEGDDNPISEAENDIKDSFLTSDIDLDCSKALMWPPEITQELNKPSIQCDLSNNYERELGVYGRFKQEILEIRDF
ncbi:DEAD/DEAH box helicase [Pseudoalteromonas sp. P1-25]|uniref:DEAD/DEAH box helicase n=1 Tax=Pseudoalteromonas sp. P1-25 TaxID=1723758 RepID=UPI0006D672DA|nr:DEAD/DEAH box helicase family protein [Pseudoalteromonas sp. P1-25]KPZ57958.1 Type III restriction enzyme, res subunit [Pseudoalteromonas sp. P1-25]